MPVQSKLTELHGNALHHFREKEGSFRNLSAGAFVDAVNAAGAVLIQDEAPPFESRQDVDDALAGCDIPDERHAAAIKSAAYDVLIPRG